ncbi:venom acid phosphatase Acph-1 isoform X2 [Monomorium pharaonis]|uniref:venom acid phosphatase Acph-1 isoform X2 n=1 Tax=Monomorium pharaonis TaxID=307658 RepID=UPI00174738F5|nr:venom acid phosphatase Acph-1 isoform X2 [Monomorium pharaonis]
MHLCKVILLAFRATFASLSPIIPFNIRSASNMVSFRILDNYLSVGLIISLNAILLAGAPSELKLVNVVFRHGDRTPDNGNEMYPNDPYLNYSFFPEGIGQLTNTGKDREYELGRVLYSRYKNFLGDLYLPKLVVAHSSDYDRTKMSLQLVLASLFPPRDKLQRWNPTLNWQPIPTTYVPRVDDNFFLSDECPRYLNEYDRVLELPEIKKKMSHFKGMMNELTKLTGKKIEKPLDMANLYHTFVAESSMNLTLPKWAYDYFPDGSLFDGIIAAYNIGNYSPLLRRLYAGPMIRIMTENMLAVLAIQNANRTKLKTKIYLYGGHETNIATLLHAFKVYKPHVPEYSSAIILELLQQNNQYYVKLLHYRGIPSIIDELTIPGCKTLCPFKKFSYLIRNLIPSDEELVCDKRQTSDYANTKYPATLENTTYNLIKSIISLNDTDSIIYIN